MANRPSVVIVGGGFGGLAAARALARAPVDVTLVDRPNHHLFQPLLYQVATAGLSPAEIAHPIRRILRRQANARVLLGEAVAIDPAAKRVIRLGDGALAVRLPGPRRRGRPLLLRPGRVGGSTRRASRRSRTRSRSAGACSLAFEEAEREEDAEARRQWLTFVVVGGGPTGVEMAGAFAEIARHTLARRLPAHRPAHARASSCSRRARASCPSYPRGPVARRRSASSRRSASRSGPARPVTAHRRGRGRRSGGERIAARTVVWAAGRRGLAPRALARRAARPRRPRAGRTPTYRPGQPAVFVIGDLASRRAGRPARPRRRARRDPDGRARGRATSLRALARRAARCRSATATRARSRRSAAGAGSRCSGGCGSPGSWPGSPGWRAHLLPDRLPQPPRRAASPGPGPTSPTTAAPASSWARVARARGARPSRVTPPTAGRGGRAPSRPSRRGRREVLPPAAGDEGGGRGVARDLAREPGLHPRVDQRPAARGRRGGGRPRVAAAWTSAAGSKRVKSSRGSSSGSRRRAPARR